MTTYNTWIIEISMCQEPNGEWLIEHLNQLAPSWLYQIQNQISANSMKVFPSKLTHSNIARMLREGADLFDALSNQSHLILILDNADWSDLSSLDPFNFLMFRCSPAKLLIIISYRPCKDNAIAQRIETMRNEYRTGVCVMKCLYRALCVDTSDISVSMR